MAAKKQSSPKAVSKKPSKTSFILGLPRELPAAEVVAKAKEAGITLTDKYVYRIRSSAKKRGAGPARLKPGPKPRGRQSVGTAVSKVGKSEPVEARFVALALDVGLSRAEELLTRLRAKAQSIAL
jgi:hypothetical protein